MYVFDITLSVLAFSPDQAFEYANDFFNITELGYYKSAELAYISEPDEVIDFDPDTSSDMKQYLVDMSITLDEEIPMDELSRVINDSEVYYNKNVNPMYTDVIQLYQISELEEIE